MSVLTLHMWVGGRVQLLKPTEEKNKCTQCAWYIIMQVVYMYSYSSSTLILITHAPSLLCPTCSNVTVSTSTTVTTTVKEETKKEPDDSKKSDKQPKE